MGAIRLRRVAFAVAPCAMLAYACSQAPAAPRRPPLPPELREFLPEPWSAAGEARTEPWGGFYDRLLAGDDARPLAAEVERLLPAGSQNAAGWLLLSECRLVGEQWSAASEALARLPTAARRSAAATLVEARVLEGSGDVVEAYATYRWLGDGSAAAHRRAVALESAACALLGERVEDLIDRGHTDDATRELARLAVWRPHDRRTSDLQRRLAAATGAVESELAALRAMAAEEGLADDLAIRHAELELEAGNPDTALRLLDELAARRPGDEAVKAAQERVRFGWRLRHAPEQVQRVAESPQLTRADLARLLYWLVPGVRSERGGVARIASDVVGHPAQEEVVRVLNLGLMRMDETLHRFEPDRPVRRSDAIEAVLRAARPAGASVECAAALGVSRWSWDGTCAAGASCGILPSVADCLPSGPLSGAEALDWILRAGAGAREPK